MNMMIATHNKYLESGLKKLLSRHPTTTGADFFTPDNREHIINNNIFVTLCDRKNSMLMNYILNGYRFYLLLVESISSLSPIYEYTSSGRLLLGNSPHKLTMNEMIILFYYVLHGRNVASIAYQFGMSSKTVYTYIYKAEKKNGISGKNLKCKRAYERLVCQLKCWLLYMKVICDNRYFPIGINKTIEDITQKNRINGVKNIVIISSPKTSDVFCSLQFNNIDFRCSDTVFYVPPETLDFLRSVIHAPTRNIKDLTKNNPLNNIHYIYRVKSSHYKLSLSGRQKGVLLMFLYGLSGRDIANNLDILIKTASNYKKPLMSRLYVSNDIQLFYRGLLLRR